MSLAISLRGFSRSIRTNVSCITIGFLCFGRAHAIESITVYCSIKNDVAQSVAERFGRAVVSSDREVVDRVAAGEFAIGFTDSTDLEVAANEGKPVGAVFPDQESFGTLIVPSALVLMAKGPNPEQGKRFIDFLLRSEIQKLLGASRETLIGGNIKPTEIDYVKLIAQSKELSRGFLKEWVNKQK